MNINDFTDKMRQEISCAIKRSLLKLGIDVDVTLSHFHSMNDGQDYIKFHTTGFNTTPVIYKNVYVEGSGRLYDVNGYPNTYDLFINTDYRFILFCGGTNGVNIGAFHFRVFEGRERVSFLGFTIY